MAATARHWKHAMAGLLKGRASCDSERHQHNETASIWSTIPLFMNIPKLPAKQIRSEPPEVKFPYDESRLYRSEDIVYNPDSQQMVIAILSFMINKPHTPLPPDYNSHLLHILESYSSIQEALNEERRDHEIDTLAMEDTLRQWEKDRKDFKAEIKRLEEHIAKQEGVEAMHIARTKSLLRRRDYETAENAIGRIRRGGTVKQSQRSDKKLLHQPSVTGPSRVRIPPCEGGGTEINIGKPEDSEVGNGLSRFLNSPLDLPKVEAPTQNQNPQEVRDNVGVQKEFLAELDNIQSQLAPIHRARSSLSSGNSSVVTVINMQKGKQRQEPAGQPYSTSCSSKARRRSAGISDQVAHSRNFSFVPGDDFRIALRDQGPSSQLYSQAHASSFRPEVSSIAPNARRKPQIRFQDPGDTEVKKHPDESRESSQSEVRRESPQARPRIKGRTKSEGYQILHENASEYLGVDGSITTKATRRDRAASALGAFTQMAGALVIKKKENKDSPQKVKGLKHHSKDDTAKGERSEIRTAGEIARRLRF